MARLAEPVGPARPLATPLYRRNAHAAYRLLREAGPVQRLELPGGLPVWAVTRYREAQQALTDERLGKDPGRLTDPRHGFAGRRYPEDLMAVLGRQLLNTDGADHRALRELIRSLFSVRALRPHQGLIERTADRLLAGLAGAGARGPVDLVTMFARPLATRVIAGVLGIADDAMARLVPLTRRLILDDPTAVATRRAYVAFALAVEELVRRGRERPGGGVVGELIRARDRDGALSEFELQSMIACLLVGGFESTTTLLAAGAAALVTNPGSVPAMLDGESAPHAVQELLRYQPPIPFSSWRFALEPFPVGATVVPRGDIVLVMLAGANRDPAVFPAPDVLDVHRARPAPHLSFGWGEHYCPGAYLAAMEARIGLAALLRRFPRLRLGAGLDELSWHGTLDHALTELPVLVGG